MHSQPGNCGLMYNNYASSMCLVPLHCFRLEVHADVAASSRLQKCASLSSDSANLSLDAKSATVSFYDDASTRALTGSLCTRYSELNGLRLMTFLC